MSLFFLDDKIICSGAVAASFKIIQEAMVHHKFAMLLEVCIFLYLPSTLRARALSILATLSFIACKITFAVFFTFTEMRLKRNTTRILE